MNYEIKIKRCKKGSNEQYWQSFMFEGSGEETVAAVIDRLNTADDLFDKDGKPADRIVWPCSCNQGICGACAMVINKVPALACKTKLNRFKGNVIVLEPLTKFPLIADLKTDRTSLYEAPIIHEIFNEGTAEYNPKLYALEYEAAKCMKCGICVEVCPNTGSNIHNLGATFAVDCFLKCAQSADKAERSRLKKEYDKAFSAGCSKSMSCAEHCPQKIDLKAIINHMNRG